jgi:hypothetical protein
MKRRVLLAMVAYLSASPGSWKLIARTLGAVFAGSAVTMSATVLHGGSLLLGGVEPVVTTKPPANRIVAPSQQLPEASLPAPDQAAPWAPGAAPQWPPPPYPFSMPPPPVAPVFGNPWDSVHFSAPPAAPASPEQPAAAPVPPPSPADVATHGSAGSPPQTTNPPHGGPVGGVLGDVFHATDGTPR